jgi:molybdopterin synthase sulfur carrier subunit
VPTVLVPAPYRGPTRGDAEIPVRGGDVRSCLLRVEDQYPGFLAQVLDAQGEVHRFVKLFLNEVQLEPSEALATATGEGDRVEVLAAIAGG